MKTKTIVNSALAVLVALGVAACSSGGNSVSSELKKSTDKVKQEAKKPLEKAKDEAKKVEGKVNQKVDQAKEKLNEKKVAPQTINYVARAVTAHNQPLDADAFNKFTKDQVKFSDAGEMMIEGKKVLVDKIYVVAAGKAVDFVNYKTNQWKYQTFGALHSVDEKQNVIEGFVSVGNKTDASMLPKAGVVNYKGDVLAKSLVPHQGMDGDVKAMVAVDVDFATKQVSFKTENTQLNQRSMPYLDLTGSAKLDATKNEFVDGSVHLTKMPRYQGQFNGAVFGPKAEEVGGTFNVQNGYFIGGFGAKK